MYDQVNSRCYRTSYPDKNDLGWPTITSMNIGRMQHTASLLNNGKVLVAGGADSMTLVNSVKLYDYTTGAWSPTDSMQDRLIHHTASVLTNENDPVAEHWTYTGIMTVSRIGHTSSVLTEGQP